MSNKQTTKIIDKIKKENIKPLPKWKVDFKSYLYWAVLIFLILVGGLFISLALIDYLNIGPELARNLKLRNFLFTVFRATPILWIILLVLSLVFGIAAFRSTKRGYRYSIVSVLILMVFLISVLGFLSHISKIDQRIKNALEDRPHLNKFGPSHEKRFFQPENGIIVGKVEKIEGDKIILRSPQGKWRVYFSEDTKIKGKKEGKLGRRILVIGNKIDEENFQAKEIIFGRLGKVQGVKTR